MVARRKAFLVSFGSVRSLNVSLFCLECDHFSSGREIGACVSVSMCFGFTAP